MIKAVLFDLDGTLVDSLLDLANAVNFALQQKGFPTQEIKKFNYFVGNGIPKLIERALPEYARNEKNISEVMSLFFEHYSVHFADNTRAYEGIEELVAALGDMGIKMAVVSNKAQAMAERVVERAFGETFNIVLGMRDGVPAKPDPTLAYEAASRLNVLPEECIFMGDSGMDMATAVNCGAIPVGVLWGFRTEDELRENGAGYIIGSPDLLLGIIGGLNK